jgi:hypothetical protein
VDRLLKQIATFMSDIADEFKIVVVEAIRSLCLKFPAKHRALMNFLSNVLREVCKNAANRRPGRSCMQTAQAATHLCVAA